MPTRNSLASYWGSGGRIVITTVSDPAAGAEWITTVPVARRWRFIALRFRFATDANVANRDVHLDFDDGVNEILVIGAQASAAANIGRQYYYNNIPVLAPIMTNALQQPSPPNLLLEAGFRIGTRTVGIQVGDQFSAIRLWTEEWNDPL